MCARAHLEKGIKEIAVCKCIIYFYGKQIFKLFNHNSIIKPRRGSRPQPIQRFPVTEAFTKSVKRFILVVGCMVERL